MTQKGSLFKGQQKKKSIPLNRHGKTSVTRKGKRAVKPAKVTKEMESDKLGEFLENQEKGHLNDEFESSFEVDLTKFINYCNEVKAATVANKDGGHLSIVKTKQESTSGDKK